MHSVSLKKQHRGSRRRGSIARIVVYSTLVFVILPIFLALYLPGIQRAREVSRREKALHQMKQIGSGLKQYYDIFNAYPPSATVAVSWVQKEDHSASEPQKSQGDYERDRREAAIAEQHPEQFDSFISFVQATMVSHQTVPHKIADQELIETPYHGWMTAILPFVDQADVYKQIDFNEPWLSPKNAKVFQHEVSQYLQPAIVQKDDSSRFVNGLGAAHHAANSRVMKPNSPITMRQISDGMSNTILMGEVSSAFQAWGSPDNTRDPAAGIGGAPTQFGSSNPSYVLFLFCDGSVQVMPAHTNPNVLKALAEPDDGYGF